MIAKSVHHISFSVSDVERARRFYGKILGLEEIPRPDLGPLPGVWYRAGNAEVHLIGAPREADVGTRPRSINPLANHQAFAIDDYSKTLEALARHGLQVLETNPELGQMWIRDPDGNVIELIAPRTSGAST
jgi:catechol 2,3-dioxygenase-like lactoylglutathione lyase family enzyme